MYRLLTSIASLLKWLDIIDWLVSIIRAIAEKTRPTEPAEI